MAVHLITYYLQDQFHAHEGCGCEDHSHDHSCNCDDNHEHSENCGCGDDDCGCGGDADYDLIGVIESLGRWAQFMPTSFLVESSLTCDEILDKLAPTIGSRDLLFVSKVNSKDMACLTPQVKDWIQKVESQQ